MRIAIGCMMHESNTFNTTGAGQDSFKMAEGLDFRQIQSWKGTVTDGIFNTLTEAGAEIVPLFFARAIPAGTVRREVYKHIKTRMIENLKRSAPYDGICLALHGSMAVEGLFDPEGDLLEAVRWVTGHGTPVVCALDMHATVTERMALLADGFVAYRTAPHTDEVWTGARAAEILLELLKTGRKSFNAFVKIPFLVSGEQSETRVEPAKSLFAALTEYDRLPYVLCSSYVMGFPWADSPFGGAGALVTGWVDDYAAVKVLAKKMAADFWERRADFVYSTPAMLPSQALQAAQERLTAHEQQHAVDTLQAASGTANGQTTTHAQCVAQPLAHNVSRPVIISDSGDNPTAGASQDTTQFLRLMLDSGVQNAIYTCVADPDAYQTCAEHKTGDAFPLTLGGCRSGKNEERLSFTAKLLILAETQGVAYAVVQSHGVTIVISDRRCATYDPETLRSIGVSPEEYSIIAIKAGYLSPEYQAISGMSMLALTQGDTALDLRELPYVKTPRPIYPLDPEMTR